MQAMTAAQQTNDTVVINKLMMEYNTIQQEVVLPLKQNILHAESHQNLLLLR
jgi:hypothetical protein